MVEPTEHHLDKPGACPTLNESATIGGQQAVSIQAERKATIRCYIPRIEKGVIIAVRLS